MTGEARAPKLDPAVEEMLGRIGPMLNADLASLPVAEAMAIARPSLPVTPAPPETRDIVIPGPDDTRLRLRLYGVRDGGPARPALLHFHGGGFVAGSIELDDGRCARLALETGYIVASLEYRLAPEFPFPSAIEDAGAAWVYLQDEAAAFGIAPDHSGVSGSSAGGHLAVGLCLLAQSRDVRMPRFLILTNPALDPDLGSASYREFAEGPFLTRTRMAWYWKQYAGTAHGPAAPTWNPMRADLSGFPPTLVITAECDVLRDEGEAFASRLADAGVTVRAQRHPGMIHGFISVLPDHPGTQAALKKMEIFMKDQAAAAP